MMPRRPNSSAARAVDSGKWYRSSMKVEPNLTASMAPSILMLYMDSRVIKRSMGKASP